MSAKVVRRHAISSSGTLERTTRPKRPQTGIMNTQRTQANQQQLMTNAELLTVEEVAARIRRSPATVRYWIHNGSELGPLFRKVGRRRMARAADVDQFLA